MIIKAVSATIDIYTTRNTLVVSQQRECIRRRSRRDIVVVVSDLKSLGDVISFTTGKMSIYPTRRIFKVSFTVRSMRLGLTGIQCKLVIHMNAVIVKDEELR